MSTPFSELGNVLGGSAPPPQDPGAAEVPDNASITAGPDAPLSARLKYGTELHGKILAALKARLDLSWRHISKRYDQWDKVDEKCRLFFDLSRPAQRGDGSADLGGAGDRKEMPHARSIVIPASAAIREVRSAQMLSIALAREPIHQLEGVGGEDVKPAKALEATLSYDAIQCGLALELLCFYQDADKYGTGILYDCWENERGYIYGPPPVELNPMLQLLPPAIGQKLFPRLYQRSKTWGTKRQFTRVTAGDPFNFWPDPRVPVSQVQMMEFIGHRVYSGRSFYLTHQEKLGDGVYFNIEFLDRMTAAAPSRGGDRTQNGRSRSRFSGTDFQMNGSTADSDRGFYAEDCFQWKLIPKEWGLGDSDRPEIWWFHMLDEQMIVRAHPCDYEHGEFSYSVGETNPDTHALFNPGTIELMDGPQRFLDWLFNARFQNVVRTLNNRYVFDPRYIKREDVENPRPGSNIEMTIEGQLGADAGVDPRRYIFPLPVQDVTIELYKDAQFIFDMMQRQGAASDPAMSTPTAEQKTLGEVQSLLASGGQRVSQTTKVLDLMAVANTVRRQVANRQQYTTQSMYYRIGGEEAMKILQSPDGRALISPTDLQGNFDYVPITGTMPSDPSRYSQTWLQLLTTLEGVAPALMQEAQLTGKMPSISAIINETIRSMGVKNFDQFWLTVPGMGPNAAADGVPAAAMPIDRIMPDDQVAAEVAKGNMVPAN